MAYIILSKENFYHNLNQIALKTGSVEKIALVLKDNAYGHGLTQMADLARMYGIRHVVVRDIKEAKQIESYFDTLLVLGGKALRSPKLSFAINSIDDIDRAERGSRVELKVDTGMHRNGIMPGDLPLALKMIEERGLELTGLMTHYRSADELGSELFWQQKRFAKIKEYVRRVGYEHIRVHSCNSAATLRMGRCSEDLVRVGIAAYGYNELEEGFEKIELKPVLSLHARQISTRKLKKGERIGYGGDFTADEDILVSTYDLGYGDGWPRGNSFDPYITAEGLPLLGRVSMDFVALSSDKESICFMDDAQKAARHFGTISYEMSTALSPNIERTVI